MTKRPPPRLGPDEAKLIAEAASTFADPVTGEPATITVRPWTAADGCGVCGDISDRHLYLTIDATVYCSRCWVTAGRPWPRYPRGTNE